MPHPLYGEQLDRNAVPGVESEGRVVVSYREITGRFADGAPYRLRAPRYRFADLAFGPLGKDALFSVRAAPPLVGLGLLEAVSAATIEALAAEEKSKGQVHGRPNRVFDIAAKGVRLGRFGWKAGAPGLEQQVANAFNRDIGITNPLYPENDCTQIERACRAAAAAASRHPKIGEDFLAAVTFFVARLAPPAPRRPEEPEVKRGEALFAAAGCGACHRPALETGDDPDPALAHQLIHPYTDLLLHDMGAGLADKRPEYKAGGRQLAHGTALGPRSYQERQRPRVPAPRRPRARAGRGDPLARRRGRRRARGLPPHEPGGARGARRLPGAAVAPTRPPPARRACRRG